MSMKFELTIPTKLSEIKLSQYQHFIKITEDSEEDDFIGREMIKSFCNVPDEIVDQIKVSDYEEIIESISAVLTKKPDFIQKFKMDGVEYGFIPKLDDITLGEKADLDEFFKSIDGWGEAMAVLYRPILVKTRFGYSIEPYKANGEGLDTPLSIALGASVFFSTLIKDLLNFIPNYIKAEVEANPKLSKTLEENGVGTQAFINSLEGTFSNLTKLQNFPFIRR